MSELSHDYWSVNKWWTKIQEVLGEVQKAATQNEKKTEGTLHYMLPGTASPPVRMTMKNTVVKEINLNMFKACHPDRCRCEKGDICLPFSQLLFLKGIPLFRMILHFFWLHIGLLPLDFWMHALPSFIPPLIRALWPTLCEQYLPEEAPHRRETRRATFSTNFIISLYEWAISTM